MLRLLMIVALIALVGCSDDATDPAQDMGVDANGNNANNVSMDVGTDMSATPDMSADAGEEADMAQAVQLDEVEPNDGSTTDEVQSVPVNSVISGTIQAPGDADVFAFDAVPGQVYEVRINVPAASQFQPHMAVFDDGRDGDPAGQDYVKIGTVVPTVEIIAMGGGYLVAVRDRRNVEGGSVGDDTFTYVVSITPRDRTDYVRGAVEFGMPITGTLANPSGLDLYSFDATEGQDVTFDFSTTGDVDGRLYVFAESEGDWIARQDDRALGDTNPLLSAPLFASGSMFLVVENIDETASQLGYSIATSSP